MFCDNISNLDRMVIYDSSKNTKNRFSCLKDLRSEIKQLDKNIHTLNQRNNYLKYKNKELANYAAKLEKIMFLVILAFIFVDIFCESYYIHSFIKKLGFVYLYLGISLTFLILSFINIHFFYLYLY